MIILSGVDRWLKSLALVARGMMLIAGLGLLAGCATASSTPTPRPTPAVAAATPTALPPSTATPLPATKAPAAQPLPTLSPAQALPYLTIEHMVIACDEFHPNRRRTVIQHMAWLVQPGDIPTQFNNLYGNNVRGKLAFGAVYMVAVQWKVNGRQTDSCLIPIGDRLNTMTSALGETPVSEFGFAAP